MERQIVKEGHLLKRGQFIANWRIRYFILYDDGSFIGYRQKPSSPNQFKEPLNNFTIKGCQIVRVESPTHFIFVLRGLSPEQEIERNFSAGNHHDRDSWCAAITETSIKLQEQTYLNTLLPQTPHNHHPAMQHQQHQNQQLHLQNNNNLADQDSEMIMSTTPNSFPNNNNNNLSSCQLMSSSSSGGSTSNNFQNTNLNNHLVHNNHQMFASNGGSILGAANGGRQLEYVQQSKKMSLEDFNHIKIIGRGSWGKVMLSREKVSNSLFAIKILKKHVIISQNEVSHTLTESRVLRTTNHPFLIALKYSFRDGERLCFVMEFAAGGELFYHLSSERIFSEDKTRFYGAEIVSALGYLHEHEIIYRDLKLENLLLGCDGHIKIADFGLCKDNITFKDTTRTFCGTPEYLSPEVIEDNQYGRAVDWWSLGVLLYEMMCGSLPFNNKSTDLLFREILLKAVTFPASISDPAKSFLAGLLNKDPTRRLGGGPEDAKEIMIHTFFRGLDWQDLIQKKITPPFVPQLSSETDTRYFDRQFTAEPPNLTPIDRPPNRISDVATSYFTQFSFAAGSQL